MYRECPVSPADFRDLQAGHEAGNELATNAIEVFSYRVAKYIGSYVAAMNGVDAIAFTAGIGENVNLVREKVMSYLGYLGVTVDQAVNDATHGDEAIISTADSKGKGMCDPDQRGACDCKRDGSACKIVFAVKEKSLTKKQKSD